MFPGGAPPPPPGWPQGFQTAPGCGGPGFAAPPQTYPQGCQGFMGSAPAAPKWPQGSPPPPPAWPQGCAGMPGVVPPPPGAPGFQGSAPVPPPPPMAQQGYQGMTQQGYQGMAQQGCQGMPQQGCQGMPQQGYQGMPQQGGCQGMLQQGCQGMPQQGCQGMPGYAATAPAQFNSGFGSPPQPPMGTQPAIGQAEISLVVAPGQRDEAAQKAAQTEKQNAEQDKSFKDTLDEARRKAEEAVREEQRKAKANGGEADSRPPPTQADQEEFQLRLARFPNLDSKALNALNGLDPRDAVKALTELENKGPGIRNPSAWICKTTQNVRDRSKPPPPPEKEEKKEDLGIVDHYGALEVPEDADEKSIKKAYRKLVLKWHPDKNPEARDEAEEKIRAINNAYETLSNATKRQTYDTQRQAVIRQKQGMGPDLKTAAPRQRIPREFMLQPIGFPDKFVRYGAERAQAHCEVNSRQDARLEGKNTLDQFVPFFKACKLSLWWLPDVNNMCRIRALEARSRSSAGEKVVAGRPGGYNLGFEIAEVNGRESDIKLIEAGKGEMKENVNFIVIPSPLYDNAFRFEAAYRKGFYLAFRCGGTQLRMIPLSPGGTVPPKVVVDFQLVDFQAMFKFIDVEEVLRPVIESHNGWVSLDKVKADQNVAAYFSNILQRPMWDDDDFQSYFEGHFEMWEWRCDSDGPAVRLRGVDERLGYALEHVRTCEEASKLLSESGDDLPRLHWRYAVPAFEALNKGTESGEDVSALLQRMEGHRRLLTAMLNGMLSTASEASLPQLVRLARVLKDVGGKDAAPDVAQKATEVCSTLSKLVLARAALVEKGAVADLVTVEDLPAFLALPGMRSSSDVFTRIVRPPLKEAPLDKLLESVAAANLAGAAAFAMDAGKLALRLATQEGVPVGDVASTLQTLCAGGLLLDGCAAALTRSAKAMPVVELLQIAAMLGEKGFEGSELVASCQVLQSYGGGILAKMPYADLIAVAVAATKSSSLSSCIPAVVEGAVSVLSTWPAADVIRLLLAVAKAKKGEEGVAPSLWAALLREAAATVAPHLGELPAAELIRLALAAKTSATASDGSKELLEAVAKEACRRLSDLPQAHLLLLTQGLASLGGDHPAIRQICNFWGEVLRDDTSGTDEVSKRRKEVEAKNTLSGEQVAKLAVVLDPLRADLDSNVAEHCFSGIGTRLLATARSLPEAARKSLLEQVRKGEGAGSWESGREKLRRALEKSGRSKSRSKSRKRSRSRSRNRSRSRSKRKKRRRSSSSDSRRRKRSRSRS